MLGLFMMGRHGDPLIAGQFKVKEEVDDVIISYKWKRSGFFKKDAPLRLVLSIKNENPHKVMVRFRVQYYWKTVLSASSDKSSYCVKPHRRIRGKMWDLVFSSGKFNEEKIHDEFFLWEIAELEITHHADCHSRLNIKFKPEIKVTEPIRKQE